MTTPEGVHLDDPAPVSRSYFERSPSKRFDNQITYLQSQVHNHQNELRERLDVTCSGKSGIGSCFLPSTSAVSIKTQPESIKQSMVSVAESGQPTDPNIRSPFPVFSPNDVTHSDGSLTLYEDRYCRLTSKKLILKTYYFPSFLQREINLSSINALYYTDQGYSCCTAPTWGCSLLGIWWGCDFGRDCVPQAEYVNVAIAVDHEACRKGFTITDFETFFRALKFIMPHDIIIISGLPR